MHYGVILDIINYRYVYHKKDTCYLLVSGYWSHSRNRFIDNLEKKGIFKKIIFYNCNELYKCEIKEELIKKINTLFRSIERELDIDFRKTINFTHSELDDAFSIFTSLNDIKIKHLNPYPLTEEILEIAYNELYRQGLVSDSFYSLQRETEALGVMGKQIEINFLETMEKLSVITKHKIMRCTGGYTLPDKKTCLLLTSSIGMMKSAGIEIDEIPFVYQLLLDYYVSVDDKLLIKPHPHSPDLTICFDKKMVLSGDINIEILRYGRSKLKKTYSVISATSSKLRDIAKETIELGHGFFQYHLLLPVVNDLLNTFGNTDYSFYQDFIQDTTFIKVLANNKKIEMDMKQLPIPDGFLRKAIVLTDCIGHVGGMNNDSEYSVFVLGQVEDFIQRTNYCIQIEYQNEYMGGYLNNRMTVFTNDSEILDRLSSVFNNVLPYSHNHSSKKICFCNNSKNDAEES